MSTPGVDTLPPERAARSPRSACLAAALSPGSVGNAIEHPMMLREAFGLRRDPFMDTADPAFYFETMATANGRRRLYECLAGGRGLAAVVGPVGAGKTSLCNAVTAQLLADPSFLVALILDPTFADESELLPWKANLPETCAPRRSQAF